MRNIKFRAMDVNKFDKGKWRYGSVVISDCGSHATIINHGKDYKEWDVDPKTITQYTGIKDKDNVEIYEGDILRYVCKSTIETFTKPVLFKDGCFTVEECDCCDHCVGGICSDENHEGSHVGFVIGNIYENPELLS